MRPVCLLSILLLACVLPLTAQEGDDGEARKVRGPRAWFVATAIPDDLENPVKILTGKDLVEVTLSRRMASDPVKIPEDRIIRMVRRIENPKDPDKPYQTLAQARIPAGVSKALVILVPAKKSESGLVYHTRVQNLAEFRGGDYLYLNLTKLKVAVKLGDRDIALPPGATRIYKAPRLTRSTNTPISYHYYHPTKEAWKLLSASTVVLRPTRREICIFSWDPRFERINYHGVTFPVTP